jgi:hypothetical protein
MEQRLGERRNDYARTQCGDELPSSHVEAGRSERGSVLDRVFWAFVLTAQALDTLCGIDPFCLE